MRVFLVALFFLQAINISAQSLQHEKVFITADKMLYATNDTIRLTGVVLNEQHKSETYSNYAYIDIIDRNDSILSHQKVARNENGLFSTEYAIPSDLHAGIYHIRAYTRFMQNFTPAIIPSVTVSINQAVSQKEETSTLYCDFFPEGKNVGKDKIQRFGVYIRTADGTALPFPFTITNDEGTTLISSTTSESGWQMISVMPVDGQHLYLNIDYNGKRQSFLMPNASDGEHIRLMAGKKTIAYEINGMKPGRDYRLFLYSSSFGLLAIPSVSEHGTCLVDEKMKGVVTLLLTDNKGDILSEASAWHDFTNGETSATATTITRFIPADTPIVMLSSAEQQIYFSNDFSSTVPFPTQIMFDDAKQRSNDINTWLFSASFNRLDMTEAVKGDFVYNYVPETECQLRGTVKTKDGFKLKRGTVVAMCLDNGIAEEAEIGKDSRFMLTLQDFTNGDTFFLQAKENDYDKKEYTIVMDKENIPPFVEPSSLQIEHLFTETANDTYTDNDSEQLSEIKITAKARRVKYTAEDRFYKNRYIESEDIEKFNIISLHQLLRSFFSIYMTVGERYITTRRPSVLHHTIDMNGDNISNTIPLVIDGVKMELYEAEALCTVDDIVYVEYLSPAQTLAQPGCFGCINGAVAIKTGRKFKAVEKRHGTYYTPLGISSSLPIAKGTPSVSGQYIKIEDTFTSDGNIKSKASRVSIGEP